MIYCGLKYFMENIFIEHLNSILFYQFYLFKFINNMKLVNSQILIGIFFK